MTTSPTTRRHKSSRPLSRGTRLAGRCLPVRHGERARFAPGSPVEPEAPARVVGALRPLRRRRPGARPRESGFTLLELMLVVIIVSTLVALVWPHLARVSRTLAVRAAARDLVGVMGRARLEAVGRREPVEVRFSASSVTVVRPQPRYFETGTSVQAAPVARPTGVPESAMSGRGLPALASSSADGLSGSLAQGSESEEVTVLEYPLGKSVAWSRLQVLAETRDVIPQPQDTGLGQATSTAGSAWGETTPAASSTGLDAFSTEGAVTITFYPDGTSDDALIGVGERQAAGTYPAAGTGGSAVTASGEMATDYVIRVRGLVARATLLRTADQNDENYFAEVPDEVASLSD